MSVLRGRSNLLGTDKDTIIPSPFCDNEGRRARREAETTERIGMHYKTVRNWIEKVNAGERKNDTSKNDRAGRRWQLGSSMVQQLETINQVRTAHSIKSAQS